MIVEDRTVLPMILVTRGSGVFRHLNTFRRIPAGPNSIRLASLLQDDRLTHVGSLLPVIQLVSKLSPRRKRDELSPRRGA